MLIQVLNSKIALQLLVWLVLVLSFSETTATIKQISSFSEAKEILDTLDTSALVVFDVDGVLIECEDPILQTPNKAHLQALIHTHTQKLSRNDLDKLISIVYLQAKRVVVEPEVVALIKGLHEKKISVLGLTATRIGKIGKVDCIQTWRIDDLKNNDIVFTPCKEFVLDTLSHMGPSPVCKGGILFSATYPKGLVLRAALDILGCKPSTVVFFDDSRENVLSVERHMKAIGVPNVFTFEYLGAHRVHAPVDITLGTSQIQHLIQHEMWMSALDEKIEK
jgi:beta-phosphoglucomutase-like phosphatase (HAD superfamily)